jgi:hypothetical protein
MKPVDQKFGHLDFPFFGIKKNYHKEEFVHSHYLLMYSLVSTLSCILWNQNTTPYAQCTHNFVQKSDREITRRTSKNEKNSKSYAPLSLSFILSSHT